MTTSPAIADLTAQNVQRWRSAKVIRTGFDAVARRLIAAKARYQAVTRMTGVPWFVIAVIHQRESSQSWAKSLAQGDPWDQVSKHEPKGRGPFDSWESAAVDALVNCGPYAAKWKDWSTGGTLTLLEEYNGLGYANRGLPSPYIWSGTNQYTKGKYVADGVFDPNVVDAQLGCAGLLLAMRALDPTIRFADEAIPPDVEVPLPAPKPKIAPHVATGGVVAAGTAAAVHSTSTIQIVLIALAVIAIAAGIYYIAKKG